MCKVVHNCEISSALQFSVQQTKRYFALSRKIWHVQRYKIRLEIVRLLIFPTIFRNIPVAMYPQQANIKFLSHLGKSNCYANQIV